MKIYGYPYNKHSTNSDGEIIKSVRRYLNDENAEITVARDKYGKPHIAGIDGIYVSVAHDKELCLVIVAQRDVGIDIEKADRKIRNAAALAKRYFCEDEIAFLGENPTDSAFTDIWVKKEALSKLIGKGIPCMKHKSVFSDDIVFGENKDYDGYVSYYVYHKD